MRWRELRNLDQCLPPKVHYKPVNYLNFPLSMQKWGGERRKRWKESSYCTMTSLWQWLCTSSLARRGAPTGRPEPQEGGGPSSAQEGSSPGPVRSSLLIPAAHTAAPLCLVLDFLMRHTFFPPPPFFPLSLFFSFLFFFPSLPSFQGSPISTRVENLRFSLAQTEPEVPQLVRGSQEKKCRV